MQVVSPMIASVFSLELRRSAVSPQKILPTKPNALPIDKAKKLFVDETNPNSISDGKLPSTIIWTAPKHIPTISSRAKNGFDHTVNSPVRAHSTIVSLTLGQVRIRVQRRTTGSVTHTSN